MERGGLQASGGGLSRRDLLKLAAGSSLALATGCSPSGPLRFAIGPWCGYQFLSLAEKDGQLPDSVRLVRRDTSFACLQDILQGKVDAAALTLDQTLSAIDAGTSLEVVMIFDVSVGADVALARPEIPSLADLRGKRLGVEAGSIGTLMLAKLLEAAGLQDADLTVVSMSEDHPRAWRDFRLDAILTYEPWAGQLENSGLVRLFDSRSIPQTLIDVLAVRAGAARRHRHAIEALVLGHFRALRLWQTNPIDTAYRLSPLLGVPAEAVPGVFRGLDLPDLAYNRYILAGPSAELLASARDVAGILKRAGTLRSDAIPPGLFTAGYLPAEIG